jgi:hypothetical protein
VVKSILTVLRTVGEFWRTWITVAAPIAALALPFTADKDNEKVIQWTTILTPQQFIK